MGVQTEYRSIYRHGFARVAACTTRCTLADPAANAAAILEVARACHTRGAALAVFPELGVSGYAISDLLHQTALLDAVEAVVAQLVVASADLLPRAAGWRAAAPCRRVVQLRARDPSRQAAGCRAQGASAQLPRVLRAAAFRSGRRHGGWRDRRRRTDRAVRHRPAVRGRGRAGPRRPCRDLRGLLGAGPAQLARRRWPARPCSPTCRPATSRSARRRRGGCSARRSRRAASRPISTPRRGRRVHHRSRLGRAGLDLRERRDARRDRALPVRRARSRSPTSTSTCCARSACGWARFDDNRRARSIGRASAASRSGWIRPPAIIGLERKVERFPFVPADPARLEQDCYEAYNIQVSGLAQRLRATGIKRVVIGVSGGLDSTHALIVAAKRSTCSACRAPTSSASPCPGFATGDAHQGQRHPADEGARASPAGDRHPPRRAADARPTWATPSRRASRSTT